MGRLAFWGSFRGEVRARLHGRPLLGIALACTVLALLSVSLAHLMRYIGLQDMAAARGFSRRTTAATEGAMLLTGQRGMLQAIAEGLQKDVFAVQGLDVALKFLDEASNGSIRSTPSAQYTSGYRVAQLQRKAPITVATLCGRSNSTDPATPPLFLSVVNNFAALLSRQSASSSADPIPVPVIALDNTDCEWQFALGAIDPNFRYQFRPLKFREESLGRLAHVDCPQWLVLKHKLETGEIPLSAVGVHFISPEMPLGFAGSHRYARMLARSLGHTAFLYAHSDAMLANHLPFALLTQIAAQAPTLFGTSLDLPCMVQTNYDVLALYFEDSLRRVEDAEGYHYDPRLWYFADNDLASRCHEQGMPIVTFPQLADTVGHRRSATIQSVISRGGHPQATRRNLWEATYAALWQERRREPPQEWLRICVEFAASFDELPPELEIGSQSAPGTTGSISSAVVAIVNKVRLTALVTVLEGSQTNQSDPPPPAVPVQARVRWDEARLNPRAPSVSYALATIHARYALRTAWVPMVMVAVIPRRFIAGEQLPWAMGIMVAGSTISVQTNFLAAFSDMRNVPRLSKRCNAECVAVAKVILGSGAVKSVKVAVEPLVGQDMVP